MMTVSYIKSITSTCRTQSHDYTLTVYRYVLHFFAGSIWKKPITHFVKIKKKLLAKPLVTIVLFETLSNDKIFIFYFCGRYMILLPCATIHCPRATRSGNELAHRAVISYTALEIKNNYIVYHITYIFPHKNICH